MSQKNKRVAGIPREGAHKKTRHLDQEKVVKVYRDLQLLVNYNKN